jgi:hypothetical protein
MEIICGTLIDLGLSVFRVPVDAFLPPDLGRIPALLADLRAFQPELAIGLCAGNYALICRLPPGRDGWRPNLFTEVLDIPTICLWEHAPLEIASQLLAPLPDRPVDSESGADRTLRRVLTHPRLVHWSRDSGQTRIMQELGFASAEAVVQEGATLALPVRVPARPPSGLAAAGEPRVGFIGHFYHEVPAYPDPELGALAADSIKEWVEDRQSPLWDVLARKIAGLPVELRQRLALEQDQTFFWRFTHRLIVHHAQTVVRLHMLGAARVPIACYGNLNPNAAGVPPNLCAVPGHIPYGSELAEVLARHPITIDVLNPACINGFSEKPVLGFTAGGFVLVDRKKDFVDAFGEVGEAVSYTDADDLAAKVDRFLANPGYRRELGEAIRAEIRTNYTLDRVLSRVLWAAFAQGQAMARSGRKAHDGDADRHVTVVMNLLAEIRSDADWPGARVEHSGAGALVTTGPRAWNYAAAITVPPFVTAMREPHVRLRLIVAAGRIGVSVMRRETGELVAEQVVSATPHTVSVNVELPHDGAVTVILRNTVDGESRALVTEAALCDRTASR